MQTFFRCAIPQPPPPPRTFLTSNDIVTGRHCDIAFTNMRQINISTINKRPTSLNDHLSIRDFKLTSCQKGP